MKIRNGSRVVPGGQTDRQTNITKLIVAFRNFSKAPKSAEGGTSDKPEGTEETHE